jgi:hypothetical protein
MARPAGQAGDPLQRLADCALCALGVISDKVTEGGVRQNAIAALVLLATCIPVAQTQPWEPGRTRLRAGITQGGWAMRGPRTSGVLAVLGALLVVVLGATAAAAQAQATPEHENFRFPFEFSLSNPCSGEFVVFNGTSSGNITTFTDSSGQFHLTVLDLITGQGQGESGNRYRFSDTLNTSVISAPDFAPFVITQTLTDRVIAQGNAPNFVLHTTVHTTVNANGEVTANTVKSSAECR